MQVPPPDQGHSATLTSTWLETVITKTPDTVNTQKDYRKHTNQTDIFFTQGGLVGRTTDIIINIVKRCGQYGTASRDNALTSRGMDHHQKTLSSEADFFPASSWLITPVSPGLEALPSPRQRIMTSSSVMWLALSPGHHTTLWSRLRSPAGDDF
ncbi:hypothetical protein RRG08_009513 [Elysia crispata]|uniref:Uncharacterized protein n=1 Tax=Elysia crispata TaxID=231223 RepID=A0AAE1B3C9_9GAST|nr:hypothetical protein RRG08_009513 [Elysia crispata]